MQLNCVEDHADNNEANPGKTQLNQYLLYFKLI